MPTSLATPSSTEALQAQSLNHLFEYQQALKTLLDALPEARKVLMDLLHARVQQSFLKHPLPIALDAVHYEESILLTLHSGSTLIDWPRPATAQRMVDLFHNTPWGGKHLETTNRVYRFFTKTIRDEVSPSSPTRKRTVHLTTAGTPAFEQFVDDLLLYPDRYYQRQLDDFWRAAFAPDNPLTRQQWLVEQLGKAVATEAALRVADHTLEASGKELIDTLINKPSSQLREQLPVAQRPATFSVSIEGKNKQADIPLAGVFVVSSQTPTGVIGASTDLGTMLLFTPDKGLDLFSSLQALDQALRTRFIEPESVDELLGTVCWQDQARAQSYQTTDITFAYAQVSENIFEHSVRSFLTLQKQDIAHGWSCLPRHESNAEQVYELFNRLAHIGPLVDIRNRLVDRGRRYIDANLPSWYLAASAKDQQALDKLVVAELASNQIFAKLFNEANIPTLAVFARTALIRQLAIDYPDKAIDPDRVQVSITHSFNPASLGGGVGPDHVSSTEDPATRPSHILTLTLTAMALRNIDPWDVSFYTLFTGKRTSMSATFKEPSGQLIEFDQSYLKSLVQRLDVSESYDQLLQTRLITDGSALRKAWADAHLASLACATLAAQLDTRSLLQTNPLRSHQWLQAIVETDTLASRKKVGGHSIIASSMLIANSPSTRNGHPLNDVLIISLEQRRPIPNVILYTPGAPNEQTFKEFVSLEAMQHFLMQQWAESLDWRRYILQHLSKAGQAAMTEQPRQLGELLLSARSRVGNPFQTVHTFAINEPLHDALYEQRVSTLRHNADHDSTSNAEVEEQSLWNKLTFGIDLALDLVLMLPIATASKTLHSITKVFFLLKQAGASKSAARALWSITGARYFPPSAPKLRALAALSPPPDLSGMHVQVSSSELNQIKGNLYQSKNSAQHYALINGKYYLSDVAQGQRFIYPPSTALHTLRYPLFEDSHLDTWQAEPLPRLRGGMDPIEKGPSQTTHQDYELPMTDRALLPAINMGVPGAFSIGAQTLTLPQSMSASMLHLFAIQSRLRRHAKLFFSTFRAPAGPLVIPPRNLLPEPLFAHLFGQRNGVVIGETHHIALTRKLLIENMSALKRQSLERIYMEFLITEVHQELLDTFNASPAMPMPLLLKERLQWLDAHFNLSNTPHNFTQLVEAAHAQGISVMALDSAACAQLEIGDLSPPGAAQTLSDQLDRVTMFNFFAHKKIAFDQHKYGSNRWLALVGLAHCNTFQGIPGLANLSNATSIRVIDRLPTLPIRTTRDSGLIIPSPWRTHQLNACCELLVHAPSVGSSFSVSTRIHSPNMFTLTYGPPGNVFVHYLNAHHQRFDVPLLMDGNQPYVDHPLFGSVSNRRFNSQEELVDALTDELHMTEV
ncbi:UNVERIFIED_ORG: hypothetical protein EDF86_0896 [Pseudomonas psychrophila]